MRKWKITYMNFDGDLITHIFEGNFNQIEYEFLPNNASGFTSILKVEKMVITEDTIEIA